MVGDFKFSAACKSQIPRFLIPPFKKNCVFLNLRENLNELNRENRYNDENIENRKNAKGQFYLKI